MNENIKCYSELEQFEIININDGERYNFLCNNDIIVDMNGEFKFLIVDNNKSHFSLFNKNEVLEIPWECVKKIGNKTLIIDYEESEFNNFK